MTSGFQCFQDGIELTEAAEDIAGLFERNSIESIIRGAVFSSSLTVDAHFSSAVSTTSPLFKLSVDAIQRGRDHGKALEKRRNSTFLTMPALAYPG